MTTRVNNTGPRVAICVCTHNRSAGLENLLLALRDIDLGALPATSIELVVVDNRPNDETRQLCLRAAMELPFQLHYTEEPAPGVTYARNRAVAVALEHDAELIAFIDDDDHPRPDWLLRLLERQADTGADLVFGTWVLDERIPQWARESGIFRSPDKPKRDKDRRYGLPHFASGCNFLVGRDIIERVAATGPIFDHRFRFTGGEDKDFFLRAVGAGATLASEQQSVIQRYHDPDRYSVRGLVRRGIKNGCSQVHLAGHHGSRKRRVVMVASALVKLTVSLLMLPLSIFSRKLFMRQLYRMAKCGGVIYSSITGRGINYYAA